MRVIIADDHRIVRDGIRQILEAEADITVVADADNGAAAVELAGSLAPDVIVMDMTMPGMNGIHATRKILEGPLKTRVLILSMHSDRRFVIQALQAGANGYILKDCPADELVRAVRTVADAELYFCREIIRIIVSDYMKRIAVEFRTYDLSPRELETLRLIANGRNTKEIAFEMGLNPKTVESHRRNIMNKLKLHTVAELTRFAVREGFTSLN
ncbi:response regulator transcription factor [Geobacter sp. SVR]|uniref:response regulator transcription factor n=1 Tax=Geobacter sp. SVR TaxID=2495594 RepID=UPI00143EF677|nr:response regulator transcription factor [Geobacter sp. SVR]BCS54833.1 DNA-binding response regulator [Geobacter sp. SVR]GCF86359.1 DNA-binding response regulator [Geobacter sp. SVR]